MYAFDRPYRSAHRYDIYVFVQYLKDKNDHACKWTDSFSTNTQLSPAQRAESHDPMRYATTSLLPQTPSPLFLFLIHTTFIHRPDVAGQPFTHPRRKQTCPSSAAVYPRTIEISNVSIQSITSRRISGRKGVGRWAEAPRPRE